MNCPFCANPDTRVTDSRPDQDGIRRRRECLACGQRFSTIERVELGGVALVKKDGRREDFDRAKIISGVRKACEKRPIPSGAIEALAADVEKEIIALNKAEIPSTTVGEIVMERLRTLDHIAYIRFASVYRAFADVDELERELDALKSGWPRSDVSPDQLPLLPEVTQPAAPKRRRARRPRQSSNSPLVIFPADDSTQTKRRQAN
jgi:transcriptional repressor NrdR